MPYNELQNLSDREIEQIEAHNERIINQVFDKAESLPIEKQYPKLVEEFKKQGAPDNVIDKIDNNEESDLFINTQQALIDKIGIDAYEKLEKEYDKRRKQKNLQDLKKQLTVSHVLKQPSGHIKFGDAVYGFNYLGFWLNKNNTKYDLIVNSKIKNGQAYNPYATEKHSSLSKKEVERIMHSEAEAYVKYGFNYLPLSEISRKLNEKRENGVLFRFSKNINEFEATQTEAVAKNGIVMPNLNAMSVEVVNVARHDFTGRGIDAIRKAEKWANENIVGTHTARKGTINEFLYSINKDAISMFLSSSSTTGSENLGVHLAVLKNCRM